MVSTKSARGMSISTILMERYLEAANTAYEAVFRRVKQSPLETKHLEFARKQENMASVTMKARGDHRGRGIPNQIQPRLAASPNG